MSLPFDDARVTALHAALAPQRLTRVVDIGANPLEDPPYGPLKRLGLCEVWGFEPLKAPYDKLVAEAAPNEHYVNGAVGDGSTGTLKVCKGEGFTSLLSPNRRVNDFLGSWGRVMSVVDEIEMPTGRLDDFDIPQVDLVKIDIQGGEQSVFQNGQRQLRGALTVISEVAAVPLYEDQPLLDAQMAELRKSGYHLHKFLFFKSARLNSQANAGLSGWKMRSQLIDGDAVFVRELLDFRRMEDEPLKHLALLADAVFTSPDMATTALGVLAERGVVDAAFVQEYAAGIGRAIKGEAW